MKPSLSSFFCFTVATAYFLSLSLAGQANANLVINGDFEDGLNNWEWFGAQSSAVNTATLSTDTPSGSGNSADLDINEVIGLPWLVQDVDISEVAEGEVLELTASVKELRQFMPDFDAWIASQMYLLESSESGAILASGFAFYTNPEWETQSFEVTVPANANVARVLFTPQNPSFGVGTGRYLVDDVVLTVKGSALGGDYNEDGVVNLADFTIWRDSLGASIALPGENPAATTPGVVDAEDYEYWKSQFGTEASAGIALGSTAVPEASTAVSALAIVIGFVLARQTAGGFTTRRGGSNWTA